MEEIIFLQLLEDAEDDEVEVNSIRDNINNLSNSQFQKLFRVDRALYEIILNLVNPFLTPARRGSDISASIKVLTTLRFLATGSYQLDIGCNNYLKLSQSSVSRCLNEVVNALNRPDIMNNIVKFPASIDELNTIRRRFYDKYEVPGIIGCIDCTHIAIFPPRKNDEVHPEHIFVNRKGYHSINVQLICDADMKIINVNARFPGSTHDSYIWNQSNVQPSLQNLHRDGYTDYFLLGDSGYPLRTFLLTPVTPEPDLGTPEHRYNIKHRQIRSIIERCNGVLKMRFRCLLKHRVLNYSPEFSCKIINACVVLHNLCVDYNIDFEYHDEDEAEYGLDNVNPENGEEEMGRVNPDLIEGRRARINLINQVFL